MHGRYERAGESSEVRLARRSPVAAAAEAGAPCRRAGDGRRGVADGSLLMNPGALVTIAGAAPEKLIHFVFENGACEANGVHPIHGAGVVDSAGIAKAAGIRNVHEFSELWTRLQRHCRTS